MVGIILVVQGGKDTTRLVDAAEKQAVAAKDFSDSAAKINDDISEAVDKLKFRQARTRRSLWLLQLQMRIPCKQTGRGWVLILV